MKRKYIYGQNTAELVRDVVTKSDSSQQGQGEIMTPRNGNRKLPDSVEAMHDSIRQARLVQPAVATTPVSV